MAIHQCIYTNSAKGLDRGGGAGVYSYSPDMTKDEEQAFVQGYCSYPRREKNRYGDEEDAEGERLPSKLLFGTVSSGRKLIANVTFLGKDYTGDMGRMGNILSHMYSFGEGELSDYPIRYYLSPSFRISMKQEEVDGSRPVQPLDSVSGIACSQEITIEKVQCFLKGDERGSRMEMFCHMMAALIMRDNVHRIIIYDTHEHILLWIGALEFALPLKIAANVSFSSFDYNPMMSDFDIRGCVAGQCKVEIEELRLQEQHYVFDGIHREYPRFDISEDFYQYGMEVGMDFAYDSLKSFHEFLNDYRYDRLDSEIYEAFRLYLMKQEGFGGCEAKELLKVLPFEEKYGNMDTCMALLEQLAELLKQSREEEKEGLWKIYVDFLTGRGSGMLEEACKKLKALEAWEYLGQLQAIACVREPETKEASFRGQHIRPGASKQDPGLTQRLTGLLTNGYRTFFADAPAEGKAAFDQVVRAVAQRLLAESEADRYEQEIELFCLVQEIGEGWVHGSGMEALIEEINAHTALIRSSKGMFKKGGIRISESQRRCMAEIQSYGERWQTGALAPRLKLLWLGDALQNAMRRNIGFSSIEEIQLCKKTPVCVQDIADKELEGYFKELLEGCEGQIKAEDYECFLRMLVLTPEQAQMLSGALLERELKSFGKGQPDGLRELLEALWNTRDMAFDRNAADYLKRSLRDKQLKELLAFLSSRESRGGLKAEAAEHIKGLLTEEEAKEDGRKWHLGGKHGGIQWWTKK